MNFILKILLVFGNLSERFKKVVFNLNQENMINKKSHLISDVTETNSEFSIIVLMLIPILFIICN